MNAGVGLVKAYLRANGYFTLSELPVIRKGKGGQFYEVTDIDLLAIRFPLASFIVSAGKPGVEDDITFEHDAELELDKRAMDVIIAEVKTGKPTINPGLLQAETLNTAILRAGVCPPNRTAAVVHSLQTTGRAHISREEGPVEARIRVMAFGDGKPGDRGRYQVISLAHAARFLRNHLRRYRDMLAPVEHGDETLELLHLLDKLS
jgi:hypothetical protein